MVGGVKFRHTHRGKHTHTHTHTHTQTHTHTCTHTHTAAAHTHRAYAHPPTRSNAKSDGEEVIQTQFLATLCCQRTGL